MSVVPPSPSGGPVRAAIALGEGSLRARLLPLLDENPQIQPLTCADPHDEGLLRLLCLHADAVFCPDPLLEPELIHHIGRCLSDRPNTPLVVVAESGAGAVAAFDMGAIDYLLAPLRPERVAESVRRILSRPSATNVSEGDDRAADPVIPVELGGRTTFVPRSAVRYVTAHGDYVRLHTDEGSHLVRLSLSTLADEWAEAGFVRIHRSTLIALSRVTQVRTEQGRCFVHLGETELQVSRRNTRELRLRLVRPGAGANSPLP